MSGRIHLEFPGLIAFQYREYRLFWVAAAFSNIGMWTLTAGRLWLMHELTESPVMLGMVPFASLAPILLLSMWGGVVADRVNRLKLVKITRGMFAALAILTGVLVATDVISPWQLLAISLATGVLLSFDIPSRQAIMPSLVARAHLAGGIAMYSFVGTASAIIGGLFFAPLVNVAGIEGLFFIIGASYIATVLFLSMMKPLELTRSQIRNSPLKDLAEGLAYVRRNRVVLILIMMGITVGIFGAAHSTLLPIYADEILGGSVEAFGRLLLAAGVGAMAGAIVMAAFGTTPRMPRFLFIAGVSFGIALFTLGRIDGFAVAVVVMGVLGMMASLYQVSGSTIVQTSIADEYRGRVMSIHQWTWGSSAFGGLLMGKLAGSFGVPFALSLGGAVAAAAIAIASVALFGEGGRQKRGRPACTSPANEPRRVD